MSTLTPDDIMTCYIKNRIEEWKDLTKKNRANSKPDKLDTINNAKAEQVIDDLAILSTAMNKCPIKFILARDTLYDEMKIAYPMMADLLFSMNEHNKVPAELGR